MRRKTSKNNTVRINIDYNSIEPRCEMWTDSHYGSDDDYEDSDDDDEDNDQLIMDGMVIGDDSDSVYGSDHNEDDNGDDDD